MPTARDRKRLAELKQAVGKIQQILLDLRDPRDGAFVLSFCLEYVKEFVKGHHDPALNLPELERDIERAIQAAREEVQAHPVPIEFPRRLKT